MQLSWKTKAQVIFLLILLSVYLLLPSILGLKELRETAAKEGRELAWYYKILPEKVLNLGLDLKGGVTIELSVDLEEALHNKTAATALDIKRSLARDEFEKVSVAAIGASLLRIEATQDQSKNFINKIISRYGPDYFDVVSVAPEFSFEAGSQPDEMRKKLLEVLGTLDGFIGDVGFDQERKFIFISAHDEKSTELVQKNLSLLATKTGVSEVKNPYAYLRVKEEQLKQIEEGLLDQTAEAVRRRIDRFGLSETPVSKSSGRLVVELPGVKDKDQILSVIRKTGNLEFHIVSDDMNPQELYQLVEEQKEKMGVKHFTESADIKKLNQTLKAKLPADTMIGFEIKRHPKTREVIQSFPRLLMSHVDVTGDMLDDARVDTQDHMPVVAFAFNPAGTKAFADLTTKNSQKQLAIVLDGEIVSAPTIDEPITGGSGVIRMRGVREVVQKDARELVLVLQEGALPAGLTVDSTSVIGPSLGRDSIRLGFTAFAIAGAAVVIFMMLYYKTGGVIANIGLFLNVLFLFACLSLFGASLTLPGIAGIVLTMGVAVDANIIVFERMKEELLQAKSMREVVASGYDNALRAIIDGNVTTFIGGVVLFQFGTGPIKGFATTLMIGIVTTLFCNVVVTRTIYDFLVERVRISKMRI